METHWKSTKQGLTIKRIARETDFHKISVATMLKDLEEEGIILKHNNVWLIKDQIKEIARIVLRVPESLKQDIEIKAIKEDKTVEDWILQLIKEKLF